MKYKLLFLAILPLLMQCKKDSSDSNDSSKTTLLAQQTWKFDNAGVDADKNGSIDFSLSVGIIPSCSSDNTLTFASTGTGVINEGTIKCTATDPQTISISWSFSNNETELNLAGPAVAGVGGRFKILALTSIQLSLSKDTTINLLPVALILNLKH